ncbi:phosphoglucosamine mutase [Tepiditoga spiralis]|uniref:Phosphoglucosamine mutase n=1 Tax=Tepiditoga spiralis TaxID=2108365 RepID=A0A7G1G6B4_9BACT|nr:phosphoglucosamine mutase [Tepiditoga spiralis]BBE30654.1 phosphoglucosamine mutase [Tepiditoga spiralis]
MKRLFGTDGIRGIVNEELTIEVGVRLANSLAKIYAGRYETLLVASDTRNSAEMFEYAIATGAISAGMNVEICGVIPTPALAHLTKEKKAIGIMISASHNPSIYNGLKVFCEGFKIPDELEVDLENLILSKEMDYSPYGEIGKVKRSKLKNKYIDYIVDIFKGLKTKYKIAIDVGNGASGTVVESIFDKLEIKYDIYNNTPDGFNINEKCGSTVPETLSNIVKNDGYDLGILFDGDADRCLFINKNGNLIDGDKLIAINSFKQKEQNRLKNDTVVTTVMSNLGFEEYLKKHGIKLLRTQVGDKYVLEKMLEFGANIGGEQSGHIIFLDRSTTGDGIITALETLHTLSYFDKSIEELTSEISDYPQLLKNVSVKDKKSIMLDERIIKKIKKYENIEDFRVLIRPSGTEHKIRVMTEGKDQKLVNDVVDEFVELIERIDRE